MFFETYGAGRVVAEGIRREWIVVAPRQGLLGLPLDIAEMLDAIAEFWPVDRSNVFLIGHSMGAGQVVRQCGIRPHVPRAAVALGGGNRMADPARAASIRFFVGAGDQDFGRGGAIQLHRSLAAAGVDSRYIEYPAVEHMVIVQAAIDDVFRFLDESLLPLR
jgi:pimeloyl-ACP methyl ester carboxylesterase